jgi:hypothetical protein
MANGLQAFSLSLPPNAGNESVGRENHQPAMKILVLPKESAERLNFERNAENGFQSQKNEPAQTLDVEPRDLHRATMRTVYEQAEF